MKTVKRNLIFGFGLSLILLVISAIVSYESIQRLLESQQWVNHTNTVINKLENVISVLKDAETGQRGFLLTGEAEFLDAYRGALEKSNAVIDEIRALTEDNEAQQVSVAELKVLIVKRFSILQRLIDKKQAGQLPTVRDLKEGKLSMDTTRNLVSSMQQREQTLLVTRTANMNRFAQNTPLLLLIASTLAVVITLISFLRVNNDFKKRFALQQLLQQRDEEITRRIATIENIAAQISSGNYGIRVSEVEKDILGSLALSLNNMAASLERSFKNLADSEWLQTGIAGLNDQMQGELDLKTLSGNIIEYVAGYTGSAAGAMYLLTNNKLEFCAGFTFAPATDKQTLKPGEGIAGQALQSRKEIIVSDIPEDSIHINYLGGEIKPVQIFACPLYFGNIIKGVIELASLKKYTANELAFLRAVALNTGIVINTAKNRKKLQEFLEETQVQAEELQAQHGEMEAINAELEIQAEKLQVSEEELKVQQEELVQSNGELEERTRLLEEKNQLIAERNKEIQKKAEELEATTKYKSEFLANMSHELRTPLNSILLLSRLLAENKENRLLDTEVDYARVILSSGQGLLSLIDEILDLSKIGSGKMELEYRMVSIDDVLNNMKALFTPVANEKKLALHFASDKHSPLMIETDPFRVEQILKNLLSNALKFTTEGSVSLTVLPVNNNQLSFTITDTGIGIPVEKQALIFEAFQQADGSTRRKFGGTGLGLSISRELAHLLGGEITVSSTVGSGSAFNLTIPIRKPAAKNPVIPQISQPQTEAPLPAEKLKVPHISPSIAADIPDDRSLVSATDKVILIIEDDINFAGTLRDYTRQKGYKCIVGVRGDEGLTLAKQYKPIGILLDIQLPVKDGWQVMEELKSDNETRHIPVHIMSSYQVKTQSILNGAADFIQKPVALDQMQEVFKKMEQLFSGNLQKVLIVEDSPKHAMALGYFLESYGLEVQINNSIADSIQALSKSGANCVILDIGTDPQSYDALQQIRKTPGLEHLPVIIFTGKSLSKNEELHIRQYADSIVIKTAHSYQRIMDEVSLFLHLVDGRKQAGEVKTYKRSGQLNEVLKNKIVLVVDDDVRNIFSLTKVLEAYNVQVLSAVDGKEALTQLELNPKIDLVLIDMMMPEMDGYEATMEIRKNPQFKKLPVIAVTAKAMAGDREKCINAGASDYITKPVDIDQLLSLLRVWMYE